MTALPPPGDPARGPALALAAAALITIATILGLLALPLSDAHGATQTRVHSGQIRVVTQNVRGTPPMPQHDVVHDVRRTAAQADVILWQEIHRPRYRHAVRSLLGWSTYDPAGGSPVSWRTARFTALDRGAALLHAPAARLLNTRRITWVLLRDRFTGAAAVFSSRHYVAAAWRHRPDAPARRSLWATGNHADRRLLAAMLRRGRAVVAGGDYNSTLSRALPYGRRLAGRPVRYRGGGFDHLAVASSTSTRVRVDGATVLRGRRSDHSGQQVAIRLEVTR